MHTVRSDKVFRLLHGSKFLGYEGDWHERDVINKGSFMFVVYYFGTTAWLISGFSLSLGRGCGTRICGEVHCTSARTMLVPWWLDQFSQRGRRMVLPFYYATSISLFNCTMWIFFSDSVLFVKVILWYMYQCPCPRSLHSMYSRRSISFPSQDVGVTFVYTWISQVS